MSSGKGCAVKEFPGLYTDLRAERMRSFITKVTGIKLHEAVTTSAPTMSSGASERTERTERTERPERTEKTDRPERTEKPERPERGEHH